MRDRKIKVIHFVGILIALAALSLVLGACSAGGKGGQESGGKKTAAQATAGEGNAGDEAAGTGETRDAAGRGETSELAEARGTSDTAGTGGTPGTAGTGETSGTAGTGRTSDTAGTGGTPGTAGRDGTPETPAAEEKAESGKDGIPRLCLTLPEDEDVYSNPVISQDENMIQILFRDENTQSDAIAWASLEPEGGPSGYYILDEDGQKQRTATAEDGSQVEMRIRKTVENSDIHGILVSWEYNGVFYELWEDDAREQEDQVAWMAAGIAIQSMEDSKTARE